MYKNSDNAIVTQKLQTLQYSRLGDWNVITGDYGYTTDDLHKAIYDYAYNWIEAELSQIPGRSVEKAVERAIRKCRRTGSASGEDWAVWTEEVQP